MCSCDDPCFTCHELHLQVTAASGAVQLMQMQEQAKRQFAVRRLPQTRKALPTCAVVASAAQIMQTVVSEEHRWGEATQRSFDKTLLPFPR